MCEIAGKVGLIVIGAIAAFGFGLLSFWLQKRWIARWDFHAVVDEQIAKLDSITNGPNKNITNFELEDLFLQDSIPILIQAARRVGRHSRKSERHSLNLVLNEYKAYHAKYRGAKGRALIDIEGGQDFATAVQTKLEKIDKCISNNPVA
jgi:hypothetical protein